MLAGLRARVCLSVCLCQCVCVVEVESRLDYGTDAGHWQKRCLTRLRLLLLSLPSSLPLKPACLCLRLRVFVCKKI